MNDPRVDRLARILVEHSCRLEPGENVLIEASDLPDSQLVCRLVEYAAERGACPVVRLNDQAVLRAAYRACGRQTFTLWGELESAVMQRMQAYIGIRGSANSQAYCDVPPTQMDLVQECVWHPVHQQLRVPQTKWVVLRYPTPAMAQAANMSTAAFEEFYFDVCTADYAQMAIHQDPLRQRMLAAEQIRLVAPGTDLQFSKAGIGVVPCHGRRNIPDGEVYTAPIRDSVEGVIKYNAASNYQGTVFTEIEFEFSRGQIVRADCRGETTRLNQILDTDEGARYIGEWSLGCNNRIRRPMTDTLFDEKIGGSLHFTPGNAYALADNGNRSRVHWDLVLIQTPAFGGGEVWFDNQLVRKDGRFLPDDLQPLNEGL